jgi:hypothetical protein
MHSRALDSNDRRVDVRLIAVDTLPLLSMAPTHVFCALDYHNFPPAVSSTAAITHG